MNLRRGSRKQREEALLQHTIRCFREGRTPFHPAEMGKLNISDTEELDTLLFKISNILQFYLENPEVYEAWQLNKVNVSDDAAAPEAAYYPEDILSDTSDGSQEQEAHSRMTDNFERIDFEDMGEGMAEGMDSNEKFAS